MNDNSYPVVILYFMASVGLTATKVWYKYIDPSKPNVYVLLISLLVAWLVSMYFFFNPYKK